MDIVLEKVLTLHKYIYYNSKRYPILHTNQIPSEVEGKTGVFLLDVKKNKLYKCHGGVRKEVKNFRLIPVVKN
jgi:hypothetical protein